MVLDTMAEPVLLIVATVIVARFLWIFGADAVLGLLRTAGLTRIDAIGPRAATVLSWAGMRGVVTLAVALTLPEAMPGRDLMLVAGFAVILTTVVVQGTTLGLVIRLAKPPEDERSRPALDLIAAEAIMLEAQRAAVESSAYDAEGALVHPRLLDSYRRRAAIATATSSGSEERTRNIVEHYDVILSAVRAGRAELVRLHRTGRIDDETLHDLEHDLDLEELGAIAAKG